MFIGLNPSTADETNDDPTIRRCIGYAKSWGFTDFIMSNIFAYRATLPQDMKLQDDPIGPDNDKKLVELSQMADLVIAAWGTHGSYRGRDEQVKSLIPNLMCLKMTKDGHPSHPLYLKKDLKPVKFVT